MAALVSLMIGLQKSIIQCVTSVSLTASQVVVPITIISCVVVVRQVNPPVVQNNCKYDDNKMPSHGMMPFLQSFTCNIKNDCNELNYTEPPAVTKAKDRFVKLEKALDPILKDEKKISAIKKLPKATKVVENLGQAAENSSLGILFNTPRFGDFFQNETLVIEGLCKTYSVMPCDVATALMDSTLNVTAFFLRIGVGDMKSVICDPNLLTKHVQTQLVGKNNASLVKDMSDALCKLNTTEKFGNLTRIIQDQFDIGKALLYFEKLSTNFKLSNNITLIFNDLRKFVRYWQQMKSLMNINVMGLTQWAVDSLNMIETMVQNPTLLHDLSAIGKFMLVADKFFSNVVEIDWLKSAWLQFRNTANLFQSVGKAVEQLQMILLNSNSTLSSIASDEVKKLIADNKIPVDQVLNLKIKASVLLDMYIRGSFLQLNSSDEKKQFLWIQWPRYLVYDNFSCRSCTTKESSNICMC